MAESSRAARTGKSGRGRRVVPRRPVKRWRDLAIEVLTDRRAVLCILVGLVFVATAGAAMAWSREQPGATAGRVATDTRRVRVEFTVAPGATDAIYVACTETI